MSKFFLSILMYGLSIPLLYAQTENEYKLQSALKKYQVGDVTGALSELNQLVRSDAKNAEVWYERGRILHEQKKFVEAINDFSKAVEINPLHHKSWYLRGYTKYISGNHRGAVDDLNAFLELHPGSALAFWFRAESKLKLGNKTEACHDWDKAYRLGHINASERIKTQCADVQLSSDVTVDDFLKKGDMKMNNGDFKGALEEYQKAMQLSPENSASIYNVGLAKFLLKDKTGACKAWQQSASIGNSEAKDMLRQHCN